MRTYAATLVLVAAFGAQCLVIRSLYAKFGLLAAYATGSTRDVVALIGLSIIEAVALYVIATSAAQAPLDPKRSAVLIVAGVLMGAIALAVPDPQKDVYAYMAYGKAPTMFGAYTLAPPYLFGPGFAPIFEHYRTIPHSDYGPLWVLVNRILMSAANSAAAALTIDRAVALALIAAMLFALRAAKAPLPLVLALALNPFVYFYYVVEAHNDLLAIVVVLAGIALSLRRPLLGACVAALGGGIKITLSLLALLVCSPAQRLRTRYEQIGLVVAIAVLFVAIGGPEYVYAMTHRAGDLLASNERFHTGFVVLHGLTGLLAVCAVALAVFGGAVLTGAIFAFHAVASVIYPWYLGWGIPYSLRAGLKAVIPVCAMFPIATIIDPQFALTPAHAWIASDVFLIAVVAIVGSQLVAMRGSVARAIGTQRLLGRRLMR